MTLEELKAKMEAAKAALAAKPEDETLKKALEDAERAYNDAKAAAGSDNPDEPDESKLDEKTKQYLAKLRKENAGHRTKAKDLASQLKAETDRKNAILRAAGLLEEEKPEEKIKTLSETTQQLAFKNAILEHAVKLGIPADGIEYFEFLVNKKGSDLQENEEMTEDQIAEIASQVKKQFSKAPVGATSTVTSTTTPTPSDGANRTVTVEQFIAMSITERSKLYNDNKDLYARLFAEAKAKKKVV